MGTAEFQVTMDPSAAYKPAIAPRTGLYDAHSDERQPHPGNHVLPRY